VLILHFLKGLTLSKTLTAQKKAEDESYQIALENLRSEVITLRNEALKKDKILLSLVDRLKSSEAKLNAQSEDHKAEIENQRKKLAEKNVHFEVAKAKQEISEWTSSSVAEPPKLFQLKCLSHASRAVTHLNRNNPSVPQIYSDEAT
jgi:hypothetical protein